ncbi:juvenile hormone esterase-like [Oratosquilla oratoria]|uniref:juvenile hormone esterase-like n=1 Tax=Oratosquilla oratoria TaxID=337810 RepID=UPI003F775D38
MGTLTIKTAFFAALVCVALSLKSPAEEDLPPPKVFTPSGSFVGTAHRSARENRKVYAFTGIPYAKPPVDNLRFKYPIPYGSYGNDFEATKESPDCIQWDDLRGRGVVGQEDCLYLNVYTNRVPEPPLYYNTQPTVVFLHAGTWLSGAGASDIFLPDYLIESDVTVVTLNHRLGPFGFLSTEDKEGPGNMGLMDQVLALEWVRDNVRYFGGMNNSITVMGSGAGGISAHLLTMTPKTRGASTRPDDNTLLHRAISQSGTAYSPHAIIHEPKNWAIKLAFGLGCPTAETKDLLTCLRQISAEKIAERIPTLFTWDEEPVPFGPVLDTWLGQSGVLPEAPHFLLKNRSFLQVPFIAGINKDDGSFRVRVLYFIKSLNFSSLRKHVARAAVKQVVWFGGLLIGFLQRHVHVSTTGSRIVTYWHSFTCAPPITEPLQSARLLTIARSYSLRHLRKHVARAAVKQVVWFGGLLIENYEKLLACSTHITPKLGIIDYIFVRSEQVTNRMT